jgi:peptidoglycan/LPS O-acetylase OafA/YrhL
MKAEKTWYPLLDVLRGPAALLVFAAHWRNLFFKDFSEVVNPGVMMKVFYMFAGAAHLAVMLFFVLSGCVIAHVIYGLHERGKWSWPSYLSARLTRLWIVLIPALVLTAVWDRVGMWLAAGKQSIYDGAGFGNILNHPVAALSDAGVFFGNVFFLQHILVPTFGSNEPVWSISYEFVYYLVYPLLLGSLVLLRGRVLAGVASVLVAGGLLVLAGKFISAGFVIWLFGVAAYFLFKKAPWPARWAISGFLGGTVLLLGCFVGSRMGLHLGPVDWEFPIAIACALAVYAGLSAEPSERLTRILRPLQGLSAVSYSVYLLHMPLLVFIASLLFTSNADRWDPDFAHLAMAVPIAIVVFGYCLLVWFFTEHRTLALRKWLGGLRTART